MKEMTIYSRVEDICEGQYLGLIPKMKVPLRYTSHVQLASAFTLSACFWVMAFSPSAVLSLLVLTTVLQLSIGLLIGMKDLRGGGNNVRMEDVPVEDILKKLPLVRVP